MSDGQFQAPSGLIAMTSPGSIRVETHMAMTAAFMHSVKAGLLLGHQHFGGSLVDKARNDAVRALLGSQAGYVLFVDGDMTFPPESFLKLVHNAYVLNPHFDVLGGLCHLRGGCIPTVDTGTGTWESHFAGSGTLEVIRTGAAFLLVKRHVFEKMGPPYFACRFPMRRLDAFWEVDSFARNKMHGANPFRGPEWDRLVSMASADSESANLGPPNYEVGEDSGFCDRAKALGFRIGVDTDLSVDHVDVKYLNSGEHKKQMDEMKRQSRLLHGVMA